MNNKKSYIASNGKLVINLEPAKEDGYIVTSPLDPELITEAETLEEAFANAQDAAKSLNASRKKLRRKLAKLAEKSGD